MWPKKMDHLLVSMTTLLWWSMIAPIFMEVEASTSFLKLCIVLTWVWDLCNLFHIPAHLAWSSIIPAPDSPIVPPVLTGAVLRRWGDSNWLILTNGWPPVLDEESDPTQVFVYDIGTYCRDVVTISFQHLASREYKGNASSSSSHKCYCFFLWKFAYNHGWNFSDE